MKLCRSLESVPTIKFEESASISEGTMLKSPTHITGFLDLSSAKYFLSSSSHFTLSITFSLLLGKGQYTTHKKKEKYSAVKTRPRLEKFKPCIHDKAFISERMQTPDL